MPALLELPTELLCAVAARLSARDLQSLLSTCRALRARGAAVWAAAASARRRRPPPERASTPRVAVEMADAADALFCVANGGVCGMVDACGVFGIGSGSGVVEVAVERQSGRLAFAGAEGVKVWDRCGWTAVAGWEAGGRGVGVGAVTWDEGGRRLAVGAGKSVVVYELRDDGVLVPGRPLRGHGGDVTCIAFAGDNGDVLASGAQDAAVRLQHARTRRGLGVLRGHAGPLSFAAAVGPDRRRLLTAGSAVEARVKLWDVEARAAVATVRLGAGPLRAVCADCTRDTVYVAAGESVRVLDLRCDGAGATAAVLSLPRAWGGGVHAAVLALREDGLVAAGVGGGGVAVWDPRGPWEARALGWPGRGGHRESRSVRALALTSCAAVVGTGDGRVAALSLDGSYSGSVPFVGGDGCGNEASSRSAVRALMLDRRRERVLAVCRADGSVECLDTGCESTVVDWDKAGQACGRSRGGGSRFWAD